MARRARRAPPTPPAARRRPPPPSSLQATALADFLLPMLDWAPDTRATAADALKHPWLAGPPALPPPTAPERGREHQERAASRSESPRRSRSPSPGERRG